MSCPCCAKACAACGIEDVKMYEGLNVLNDLCVDCYVLFDAVTADNARLDKVFAYVGVDTDQPAG